MEPTGGGIWANTGAQQKHLLLNPRTGPLAGARLASAFLRFFCCMSGSSCSLAMNATCDKQLSCWPLRDRLQYPQEINHTAPAHTPLMTNFPPTLICLTLFFLHHRILIWICTPETAQLHLCCNVWPWEFTASLHISVFGTRSKRKLNLGHSTCPSFENNFGSLDQQCVVWIIALFRAPKHWKSSMQTWKKRSNASFCSCLIYWPFSALRCVCLKLCRNKMKETFWCCLQPVARWENCV